MKTLKFKAWDSNKKEMMDVETIDWQKGCRDENNVQYPAIFVRNSVTGYWIFHYNDYVLMQYSNRYDINKKRICDGDIIKCNGDYHKGEVYRVINKNDGFFPFVNDDNQQSYSSLRDSKYEIIGNVFENNDLEYKICFLLKNKRRF